MKKVILVATAAIIIAVVLCLGGCQSTMHNGSDTLSIVCTVFPQYDWVKNITKKADNVSITLLCDNGTDMHSYQPSAEDILVINNCDVLISVGGESDSWTFDAVQSNSDTVTVNLIELLGNRAMAEELLHDHEHDESCEHDETVLDEHIWLSLKNAALLVSKISEILCNADTWNSEIYISNTENYINTLNELDNEFFKVCEKSENKTMVVADRFPFNYLVNDYGIECFAAFPGCSADTDAGFDTVISLAEKVDEYSLGYVAVTENTDGKTAQAVISNTSAGNQQTIILDSMQSVTPKDINDGVSYVSIMQKNLAAFEKLLG